MWITFDPAESARNLAERGLSFERAIDLDWDTAIYQEDTRKDYGERRFQVFAWLGDRLHVVVITPRGASTHVISFRKANRKEIERYERHHG